jgi:hypothetical protein
MCPELNVIHVSGRSFRLSLPLRGLFLPTLLHLATSMLLLGPASSVRAETARPPVVSASGFGEVSAKTPFTGQAISLALPGFEIVKATDGVEDMSWTAFLAEQDGLKVLIGPGEGNSERERFRSRVVKNPDGTKSFFMEGGSGRVGYLKVSGPRGATVTGIKIGEKFSDVYGEASPITGTSSAANCFAGMEQLQDYVLSAAPGLARVTLQFQANGAETPELAEPAFRSKLNSWILRGITLRFTPVT